ncbi:MAG TPA: CoA-binding protein [Steroidobacteraceae bacterium]|nr:CoA-binding protein [Steroidobacteraceae bacterium]
MAFQNPPQPEIEKLLRAARIIAMVGLSPNPTRPSFGVARHLQGYGYRVIPVNPTCETVLGEKAVPDLASAKATLKPGESIDIVDVFRQPQAVPEIVEDCIRLGLKVLWLQLGVINEPAAERARAAGMFVVMDRCLYRERAALEVSSPHAD